MAGRCSFESGLPWIVFLLCIPKYAHSIKRTALFCKAETILCCPGEAHNVAYWLDYEKSLAYWKHGTISPTEAVKYPRVSMFQEHMISTPKPALLYSAHHLQQTPPSSSQTIILLDPFHTKSPAPPLLPIPTPAVNPAPASLSVPAPLIPAPSHNHQNMQITQDSPTLQDTQHTLNAQDSDTENENVFDLRHANLSGIYCEVDCVFLCFDTDPANIESMIAHVHPLVQKYAYDVVQTPTSLCRVRVLMELTNRLPLAYISELFVGLNCEKNVKAVPMDNAMYNMLQSNSFPCAENVRIQEPIYR